MPTPSPIALDEFERAIRADPDVLGMFYYGSLGRGKATRFSDLDIYVWFPQQLASVDDKLLELFGLLGQTHWLELGDGTAFLGPDWTQVDIEYSLGEQLEVDPRYAGATVVKDTGGRLAQYAAACVAEVLVETPASAAAVIREVISDQLFLARHNARGSSWSAMGNVTAGCFNTYELLGRLRGVRTYGFRYVEQLLSAEEQALLAEAWPREATRAEIRRASRAMWSWTQHVWRECERVLGQSLEIELDEAGMHAAIDRMYR